MLYSISRVSEQPITPCYFSLWLLTLCLGNIIKVSFFFNEYGMEFCDKTSNCFCLYRTKRKKQWADYKVYSELKRIHLTSKVWTENGVMPSKSISKTNINAFYLHYFYCYGSHFMADEANNRPKIERQKRTTGQTNSILTITECGQWIANSHVDTQ